MLILPPALALTVVLDGRAIRAYAPVYIAHGRVLGPLDPFVLRLVQRAGYGPEGFVLSNGLKLVRVRLRRREPGQLAQTYVALAPLLRALGARVALDRARGLLLVTSPPRRGIAAPAPFDPAAVQAPPRAVFTPTPATTPSPVWTGTPRPRRTPLPLSAWGAPPRG